MPHMSSHTFVPAPHVPPHMHVVCAQGGVQGPDVHAASVSAEVGPTVLPLTPLAGGGANQCSSPDTRQTLSGQHLQDSLQGCRQVLDGTTTLKPAGGTPVR
jgi:hypothetical protein